MKKNLGLKTIGFLKRILNLEPLDLEKAKSFLGVLDLWKNENLGF